jgi:hypothetical protein
MKNRKAMVSRKHQSQQVPCTIVNTRKHRDRSKQWNHGSREQVLTYTSMKPTCSFNLLLAVSQPVPPYRIISRSDQVLRTTPHHDSTSLTHPTAFLKGAHADQVRRNPIKAQPTPLHPQAPTANRIHPASLVLVQEALPIRRTHTADLQVVLIQAAHRDPQRRREHVETHWQAATLRRGTANATTTPREARRR